MKYFTLLIFSFIVQSAFCSQRPNILFMMSDDQGWNGLSIQMHPDMKDSKHSYIQTPVLAELANQGMRFSSAYAPAPVCSPTRISLQTGKSPAALHWTKAAKSVSETDNYKLIPPQNIKNIAAHEITIAESLKKGGYMTAHFGKWHINGGGPGSHGYDEHDGDIGNEYAFQYKDPNPADIFGMSKRACEFMEKAKKAGKPFFIQMSFHALHAPQNALNKTLTKYKKIAPKGKEKEIGRAAISENLDTGIGKVLKALKDLDMEKNTYVIYMSDNGAGGKRGPLRGGKGDAWEGGIRVPMIARGPGIRPGSWCHEPVIGYDWYPTFCQWAGLTKLPEGLEGGNISHLLKGGIGKIKRKHQGLLFHFPHYQGDSPHTAYISGNWKVIKFYETGKVMLFNLKDDITETKDLARMYSELTTKITLEMEKYLKDIDAQKPTVNKAYDPAKESVSTKGKKRKKDKK